MPETGATWLKRDDVLTGDEFIRLIRIAVRDLGVTNVRFTGGEPLLRPDVAHIIAATHSLRTQTGEPPDIALTTNGLALAAMATALHEAGLRRVNVSLDTLDAERYRTITCFDRLDDVLAGLAAAKAAGLDPIKINSVLQRGVNDDEAVSLTRWALEHGYYPRFIEQMPLGPPGTWQRDDMVQAADILSALREELGLEATPADERRSAPAETWLVTGVDVPPGIVPTVGVIASVTRPFCRTCDRTRLTADGQLRTCLFTHDETDLRSLLRGGASDQEIGETWANAMWLKPAGHEINKATYFPPDRLMQGIGG